MIAPARVHEFVAQFITYRPEGIRTIFVVYAPHEIVAVLAKSAGGAHIAICHPATVIDVRTTFAIKCGGCHSRDAKL